MQPPLTDEEIMRLRDLLKVAEIVQEEAEYKAAVRLVLRTWKKLIVGLAAVIGAAMLLREYLAKAWQVIIGG